MQGPAVGHDSVLEFLKGLRANSFTDPQLERLRVRHEEVRKKALSVLDKYGEQLSNGRITPRVPYVSREDDKAELYLFEDQLLDLVQLMVHPDGTPEAEVATVFYVSETRGLNNIRGDLCDGAQTNEFDRLVDNMSTALKPPATD